MAGRLVFNMNVSLDGRVAGADGSMDWIADSQYDDVHRLFDNELMGMSGFIIGRRTYELLQQAFGAATDGASDAGEVTIQRIWQTKPKYVFSRTLARVDGTATLLGEVNRERIERIKAEAGSDLSVGGPGLAASLIALGLVDEFRMYVYPVVVGGGLPYLPQLAKPLNLRFDSAQPLQSGVVRLAYTT